MTPRRLWFTNRTIFLAQLCVTILLAVVATRAVHAQSLTNFRIANGTSGENPAVLWVGVDQGLYRKHGLNVEVIFMRSGPLAISALASSDVQMVFTSSNNVLNVAAGGLDVGVIGTVSGGRKETSWRGRKSKNRRT
jgi:ABC-type nitrate/sulfonate/bicarbonate transport system substrate-binding protein